MRIVEALELTVPLEGDIANAVVSFAEHTVSLVALVSDQLRDGRPVVGIGFNSIGRFAQSGILRERLLPRLLSAAPQSLTNASNDAFDPQAVASAIMRNEKPGGHGDRAGAVAAVELAVWDLNAKMAGVPASEAISACFGSRPAAEGVPVYAAGGYYYEGRALEALRDELFEYQALGYSAFKIKIGGATLAEDLQRVEIAIDVAGDPSRVAVDANARFDLPTARQYGRALAGYGLRWFEEPLDPLDYAAHAELIADYDGVIATGENLFSRMDVINLLRFGGLRPGIDLVQFDPGLSYGLGEYGAMLETAEAMGFARRQFVPHGGHLINLHVVTALGLGGCEAYPGVFQPFGGYSESCTLRDGRILPGRAHGWGLEEKQALAPFIDEMLESGI